MKGANTAKGVNNDPITNWNTKVEEFKIVRK